MGLNQLLLLSLNFAVRAQLPTHLVGLESNVVFIDCANSSSLSNISQAAELHQLDPKAALGRVINMRAYTAYSAVFSNNGAITRDSRNVQCKNCSDLRHRMFILKRQCR